MSGRALWKTLNEKKIWKLWTTMTMRIAKCRKRMRSRSRSRNRNHISQSEQRKISQLYADCVRLMCANAIFINESFSAHFYPINPFASLPRLCRISFWRYPILHVLLLVHSWWWRRRQARQRFVEERSKRHPEEMRTRIVIAPCTFIRLPLLLQLVLLLLWMLFTSEFRKSFSFHVFVFAFSFCRILRS